MSDGRYRAYPEYKDSGVEWIGQLPIDWEVTRIKFCALLNSSKTELNHLPRETEVTFLPMEAIGEQGELDTSRTKMLSEVSSGYTYLAEGDVCIAKITPCFENGKGAIVRGLKNGLAFATTEVVPLRCQSGSSPEFLYYLLTSAPFNKQAEGSMYGAGGQKRVADSFVANYHFAKPPLPEQTQIAKFLDYETAKIDRLIEKQEELIRLLKEKRQAVISHAVTQGLNPHAPLKDSGIPWLGQVPAHWGITYLTHMVDQSRRIMYGIVLPGPDVDVGVPIVKGGDVKPGRLTLESLCKTTFAIESGYARSRLKAGDLVYSIRGTIGDVEIVPAEIEGANLTQDAARIAPANISDNRWLRYTLESTGVFSQLEIGSLGAAVRGINIRDLKKAIIPLPPERERLDIADFINRRLEKLESLSTKAESQVALLQERRTALISAAVTGKIDVRRWQPPVVVSILETTTPRRSAC